MTRYSASGSGLLDHQNPDGTPNTSGIPVCSGDPELIKHIAALLNEDIVINGILDEFVDDVVRHTKVQS